LTTETAQSAAPVPSFRCHVADLEATISPYYEAFFEYPGVRGPLAAIREALARHRTLRFSNHYPRRVIPLLQETVACEMYLSDYFPVQGDRIEFDVIETLPVGQLSLLFATGLTDTSRISNPRIFVREDILRASAGDADPLRKGFATYAEEIRHSVEALWRNRVGYLTSSQQDLFTRRELATPEAWPTHETYDASFLPQILGESGAHLMDYVRYRHDRYGKGSDYSWDYFVDMVVRNGSVTLCQTDAHRPAQAVDEVILQKLNLWNWTRQMLPTLARRFNQFFILSVPDRGMPVSESTLRCWQELHDLSYVVGGLFHSGLEPSRLRSEVLSAGILARRLNNDLLSDGLGIENEEGCRDTLDVLERVSEELGSMERDVDPQYVLRVKQSMWRLLRPAGKALNRGSALRAVVQEIDALKDLPSFYGALLRKSQDALKNVLRTKPTDRQARILLHGLVRQITAEARALGLPIPLQATGFQLDPHRESKDQEAAGHLAA